MAQARANLSREKRPKMAKNGPKIVKKIFRGSHTYVHYDMFLLFTVGGGVHGLTRVLPPEPPEDRRIVTSTRSHGTGLVQVHSKHVGHV